MKLVCTQRIMVTFAALALIVASCVSYQPKSEASPIRSAFTNTNPNLVTNPTVTGSTGWVMSGGTVYDPNVSRGAGGAIALAPGNDPLESAIINVTAGQSYTFSVFLRQASMPSTKVSAAPLFWVFDALTQKWVWSQQSVNDLAWFGVNTGGVWRESAQHLLANTTTKMKLRFARDQQQPSNATVWLDDFSVRAGGPVTQEVDNTPRQAFDGTRTKVDSRGNWSIKNDRTGAFDPYFPLCSWVSAGRTQAQINNLINGLNSSCGGWPIGEGGYYNGGLLAWKAAGLKFFLQTSQWIDTRQTLRLQWGQMTTVLGGANADPLVKNEILGYHWDNESNFSQDEIEVFGDVIAAADTLNGARQRPLIQLQSHSTANAATYTSTESARPFLYYVPASTLVAGSNMVTMSNGITTPLSVGLSVSGTGVPPGTTVAEILDLVSYRMSAAATQTVSGVRLVFSSTAPIAGGYARAAHRAGQSIHDVSATYYQPEGILLNARTPSKVPTQFCEINPPQFMRLAIYRCLVGGGRGISIFTDGSTPDVPAGTRYVNPTTGGIVDCRLSVVSCNDWTNPHNPPPIDQWHPQVAGDKGWGDIVDFKKAIPALLPFIRSDELNTGWGLTTPANDDSHPWGISTRTVGNEGVTMMVTNDAPAKGANAKVTFTQVSGPFAVYQVRDFFTGKVLANPAGSGTWTVQADSTGTRVVRLLSKQGATKAR